MSMMRSNLLSESSEFRLLQLRSISPAAGGLLSHKFPSVAFRNPAGGRLPARLVKLQLSRDPPLPSVITDVLERRVLGSSPVIWYDLQRPVNWGFLDVPVPGKRAFVSERFGKYAKALTTLRPHFWIPFVDKIPYFHSLGPELIRICHLSAFTKDDGFIKTDAVLYVEFVDPKLGVEHPIPYMIELAQEIIRREVRKMTADSVISISERDTLGMKILISINEDEGVKDRGLRCDTFSLRDLALVTAEAEEHEKTAHILEPEGERKADNASKLAAQARAKAIIEIATVRANAIIACATAASKIYDPKAEGATVRDKAINAIATARANAIIACAMSMREKDVALTECLKAKVWGKDLYKGLLGVPIETVTDNHYKKTNQASSQES